MNLPKHLEWIKGEKQPNPELRLMGWAFLFLGVMQAIVGVGAIIYSLT